MCVFKYVYMYMSMYRSYIDRTWIGHGPAIVHGSDKDTFKITKITKSGRFRLLETEAFRLHLNYKYCWFIKKMILPPRQVDVSFCKGILIVHG